MTIRRREIVNNGNGQRDSQTKHLPLLNIGCSLDSAVGGTVPSLMGKGPTDSAHKCSLKPFFFYLFFYQ